MNKPYDFFHEYGIPDKVMIKIFKERANSKPIKGFEPRKVL